MRIGIDARPLIEKKTGIGYYLEYSLQNILKNDKKNTYYLFSDKKIHFKNKNLYNNLQIVEDVNSILKKTPWYMIKVPSLCKKYNIEVFWGTQHILPLRLKNIKKVLTIHDLVAFDFKETMSNYNYYINKALIPNSVKKAEKIIAISNSTKERLIYNFEWLNQEKIKVIYEDVVIHKGECSISIKFLEKNNIEKNKYLMYLGTIEPRKNISVLVKALKEINRKTGLKLVICGKYGWKCDLEKELIEKNKENIIFLNYVSNQEKNFLMENSFAFIFPSLYEGFGLPVLEAIRNGTIAVVANNTSLKEIIEKEELKFNTNNYNELAKKIINLYENKNLYLEAYKYCQNREKYFSWDNIAKEYINELTRW